MMRKILVIFALAFLTSAQAAVVAAPSAFQAFMATATGAGKQTVSFGGSGTPLPSPGVPTLSIEGGSLVGRQSASFVNPSGVSVPVTASHAFPGAKVAGAVGRALSKVVFPLTVGMALYDLYGELGYILGDDGAGGQTVSKGDPTVCSVAPCFGYSSVDSATVFSSGESLCQARAVDFNNSGNGFTVTFLHVNVLSEAEGGCFGSQVETATGSSAGSDLYGANYSRFSVAPSAGVVPSNNADFLAAVASKTDWSPASVLPQALADSAVLVDDQPVTAGVVVSGPATSAGTSSTTTDTSAGTQTTSVTTNNHTYQGDTITTTTTVTNTTINTGTGQVVGTQTTVADPAPAVDAPTDCDKVPDSVGCTRLGAPPVAEAFPGSSLSVSLVPAVFASSAVCPPDLPVNVDVGLVHVATGFSFASLCNTASGIVAPIVLLLAAVSAAFIFVGGLKS